MYYLYHVPGIKIGVTNNLRRRVEADQGFSRKEYQVLFSSEDIDDISKKERELQALFGYHIDHRPYKQTVDKSVTPEPVNATAYSTTFPCPLSELPEYLKSIDGHSWETPYGFITLTDEVAKYIATTASVSNFRDNRCYVQNKLLWAFISGETEDDLDDSTMFDLIRLWAEERGIYDRGDVKTQLIKLMEEVGELSQAVLNNHDDEVKDAIGDSVVVLTNLAHLAGVKIEECIAAAYEQIKNRKGAMVNGTFIKAQTL